MFLETKSQDECSRYVITKTSIKATNCQFVRKLNHNMISAIGLNIPVIKHFLINAI